MSKLYIFDFDNTIVNTAELIKTDGYKYDFYNLKIYKNTNSFIKNRIKRGHRVMILSKRKRIFKEKIQRFIKTRLKVNIEVKTVPAHFLKYLVINIYALKYKNVIVLDDMYKNEENNNPKKLYYPKISFSNIKYLIHDKIIKIRGTKYYDQISN